MTKEDKLEEAVRAYVDGWGLKDLIEFAVDDTFYYYSKHATDDEIDEFIDAYYQGDDEDD